MHCSDSFKFLNCFREEAEQKGRRFYIITQLTLPALTVKEAGFKPETAASSVWMCFHHLWCL